MVRVQYRGLAAGQARDGLPRDALQRLDLPAGVDIEIRLAG